MPPWLYVDLETEFMSDDYRDWMYKTSPNVRTRLLQAEAVLNFGGARRTNTERPWVGVREAVTIDSVLYIRTC